MSIKEVKEKTEISLKKSILLLFHLVNHLVYSNMYLYDITVYFHYL